MDAVTQNSTMRGDLYVHRYGEGPVVAVGLHGWGGTHASFAGVGAQMGTSGSLLAVDLPGYGRSAEPDPWTLESIGARVARAIAPMLDGPVILVGGCSGAHVALFAQRTLGAGCVRHLLLLEPFAFVPWYFKVFITPGAGRLFYWSAFRNPVGRAMVDGSMRRDAGELARVSGFDAPPRVPRTYLRLLADIPGPASLRNVCAPVTMVRGARSFAAMEESIRQWSGVWPDAKVVIAPTGHLVTQEAPELVAGLIAKISTLS